MSERQIADLLQVANKRLAYCEVILRYPQKVGKKNYDPSSPIDQFYKSVYNTSFHDCILIIGSLLSSDKRVISFLNWDNFLKIKETEIKKIIKDFIDNGFKEIRDQLIAHADSNNANNRFPYLRIQGLVNGNLVIGLRRVLDRMIEEFRNYTKNFESPYSPSYFDIRPTEEEVEIVMATAKPKMTDNYLI